MNDVFVKPELSNPKIQTLVSSLYGLNIISIKTLESYYDTNYHILVDEDDFNNSNISSVHRHGYTLKILNTVNSRNTAAINVQHEMAKALDKIGMKTPTPIPNKHGTDWSMETLKSSSGEDGQFLVRLLQFLPGILMKSVPVLSRELCYQIGCFTGRLDQTLKTITKPDDWISEYNPWDMKTIPELLDALHHIQDPVDRQLLNDIIQQFESRVLCNHHQWQQGFIHGDVHDENILVKQKTSITNNNNKAESDVDEYELDAIFDFGDSAYSCYLLEVSIVMFYLMLHGEEIDVVVKPGKALQGFLKHVQLSKDEQQVIKLSICARATQSLVRSMLSNINDASNAYAQKSFQESWEVLKQLWTVPENEILQKWKNV